MINLLDSSVYNRISAGEVVEKPASVVKELVENSIDAGAKHITIEIIGGGIDMIRVIDDGAGIDKDDLKKAFLPHATSKISSADDLETITTLGFRGEALASIASVSRVTVTTKTKFESVGSKLHIEGGVMGEITVGSTIKGTEMVVENLFFNTPARAKFLKKPKSEENDVTDIIQRLAIANPSIAFTYTANDKLVLMDFGLGLDDVILGVYGKDFLSDMFFVRKEKNDMTIHGYISNVTFTKSNRTYQTIILNGRYIVNQTISMAIANAYQYALVSRTYPAVILYLEMDPSLYDVNVHPSKNDVRFVDKKAVYDLVYHAIQDRINQYVYEKSCVFTGNTEELERIKKEEQALKHPIQEVPKGRKVPPDNHSSLYKKYQTDETYKAEIDAMRANNQPTPIDYYIEYAEKTPPDEHEAFPTLDGGFVSGYLNPDYFPTVHPQKFYNDALQEDARLEAGRQELLNTYTEDFTKIEPLATETREGYVILGQVFKTYLFLEFPDYLLIIDQHAAHERMLFDGFMSKIKQKLLISQPLLFAETIKANPKEAEFLREKLDYIRELGIDIEDFGNDSFKINALPLELNEIDLKKFFKDIYNDMNALHVETVPDIIRRELAKKACRSAIKAGDFLTQREIAALVDLLKGDFTLRCPHGRPIAIRIPQTDLEKWFKRIV